MKQTMTIYMYNRARKNVKLLNILRSTWTFIIVPHIFNAY